MIRDEERAEVVTRLRELSQHLRAPFNHQVAGLAQMLEYQPFVDWAPDAPELLRAERIIDAVLGRREDITISNGITVIDHQSYMDSNGVLHAYSDLTEDWYHPDGGPCVDQSCPAHKGITLRRSE